MPDPTSLTEIAAAITELMADGQARTEEGIAAALAARGVDLGPRPGELVGSVLDDDVLVPSLLMPLDDGQHVLLPALLHGRTVTHRLSAQEFEHDYLEALPDLAGFWVLTEDATYRRLTDGSEIDECFGGIDDQRLADRGITIDRRMAVWLLEPGTLARAGVAAGDIVGVTVRSDGFELAPVEIAGSGEDLTTGLAVFADALEPVDLNELIWSACVSAPGLFGTPIPPLSDLLPEAGLTWQGEQIAPAGFDFDRWRADYRLADIAELHRLDPDRAQAVLAVTQLYDGVAALVARARQYDDPADVLDDPSPVDLPGLPLDQEAQRVVLGALAEPDVAEAVLTETLGPRADGAAALGLFAETMEPRAPRSARVALRWLRGKALERLGDALAAEAAFEEARSLDPGWEPLLMDLARYAGDRGDAERGLSLARQAGLPDDDRLVEVLLHFRPVDRSDLGRNEPCWCGSGRKYKVCHRGRETVRLAERAVWLYEKARTYLHDGPWRFDLLDLAEARSAYSEDPMAHFEALEDPLVQDAVLFEGGAFAAFLADRGVLLPEDERSLAEQWLLAERSVFEVEEVRPGLGFTARDVRTGDRLDVRERTASRQLQTGTYICARLVPAGGTVQCFGGLEPVPLHQRDVLLELLDSEPDPRDLVEFLTARFAPPVLQNTEGEDLLHCEAVLRTTDPDALAGALDRTYERVDGGDPRWHETVTTYGTDRIRATLVLDDDALRVETNSDARMDRVLAALRDLQPDLELVEDVRRPLEDLPRPGGGRGAPSTGGGTALDPATDPEVLAMLEEVVRRHEAAWLDEQIPALSGVTPRQAAADPTRRPDLIRLIDSFPPATGPGQMDPQRLRAALGL